MKLGHVTTALVAVVGFLPLPSSAQAQSRPQPVDHAAHGRTAGGGPVATLPGNDAYGAIAEIVRLLDADSTTDWSRVDVERLRQHLIAMNEVTLQSNVATANVERGARFEVTGSGRTVAAIRQLVTAHARSVDGKDGLRVTAAEIRDGARLTVTTLDPRDRTKVARIRGLGFIGLLTLDDHHGPHHLALARGGSVPGHDMSRP